MKVNELSIPVNLSISLRDYFAGQALFGLMAMYPLSDKQVANRAYEYADAMMKEREKMCEYWKKNNDRR